MADTLIPEDELQRRLAAELPQWQLEDGWIRRQFKTSGWKSTMLAVSTIGHLAEAAWHHPDLVVSYAFVRVKLRTHSADGITAKDLALAAKIEQVLMWRPQDEPGAALEGTPDEARFRHMKHEPAAPAAPVSAAPGSA